MLRKIRQQKTLSNFVDNFSENCDAGGQNLLNLKAPNPPAPLAKGEKGKSERLRLFKNN